MQGGMEPGWIHFHRMKPTRDRPRFGYSGIDQVADFVEVLRLGALLYYGPGSG